MRPSLTIIDAYRVLMRNGPGGGNVSDVVLEKTVIAGTDALALDAYAAATFWNMEPRYLELAEARGLGTKTFKTQRRAS